MFNSLPPRVIPKILSGSSKLEVNETICFFADKGLDLHLPIGVANQIPVGITSQVTMSAILQFRFAFKEGGKLSVRQSVELGNIIKIEIDNFSQTFPMGTISPFEFNIGGSKFKLLFSGSALKSGSTAPLITMHISIFSEGLT